MIIWGYIRIHFGRALVRFILGGFQKKGGQRMVFMGGAVSPSADIEAMVVEWILSFEKHWRYKGR